MRHPQKPDDAEEQIARLVEEKPLISCLRGNVGLVDAPDWVTDAEYLLADSRGRYLPWWPEENADYIAIMNAFAMKHGYQAASADLTDPTSSPDETADEHRNGHNSDTNVEDADSNKESVLPPGVSVPDSVEAIKQQFTAATQMTATPVQNGVHDCWEHMVEAGDIRGGGSGKDDSELIQPLYCPECETGYWRTFMAVTMVDEQKREWAISCR